MCRWRRGDSDRAKRRRRRPHPTQSMVVVLASSGSGGGDLPVLVHGRGPRQLRDCLVCAGLSVVSPPPDITQVCASGRVVGPALRICG